MYYCRCNSKNFLYRNVYLEKTKMLKVFLHIICKNATFAVSKHCMVKVDSKIPSLEESKMTKDQKRLGFADITNLEVYSSHKLIWYILCMKEIYFKKIKPSVFSKIFRVTITIKLLFIKEKTHSPMNYLYDEV